MKINIETKKCISIAERPGTYGLKFHNEAYEFLDLDYVYLPLKVLPNQLSVAVEMVRQNFKGCGVSMPHKETVIPYLDEVTNSAKIIGAVNTILNKDGRLIGYNTDYYGAKRILEESSDIQGRGVLLLGAGGAAKAVAVAIKELKGVLTISNRTPNRARDLAERLKVDYVNWDLIGQHNPKFLLINATTVGFEDKEQMPVNLESLSRYDVVMDAIVGDTRLMREASSLGKILIPGKKMNVYQAAKQFEIYTGKKLPQSFINQFLEDSK